MALLGAVGLDLRHCLMEYRQGFDCSERALVSEIERHVMQP